MTTLQRSLHYPLDQVQHALTDVQVLGLVTTTHPPPRHPAAQPLLTAIRQRLQRDPAA